MAQAFYCPQCQASFGAELRGKSCPACGEELIHGRIPASKNTRNKPGSGSVGRAVWDHIIKRDPCAYCGIKLPPKEITIDHIQPKALGGSKGSWTNRTGSCRPCNADKAHTPLLFFLLEKNKGMDLSALKDEEGDWPIPDDRAAEATPTEPPLEALDPRRLLAEIRNGRH